MPDVFTMPMCNVALLHDDLGKHVIYSQFGSISRAT
jgi:hypothetical protein